MSSEEKYGAEVVSDYYDRFTKSYVDTYGTTLQAFRPVDEEELHRYVMEQVEMKDGQCILDAGCGVAGPALAFVQQKQVEIHGITISKVQFDEAISRLSRERLKGTVHLCCGDFHKLKKYYKEGSFDTILFLEALGHSHDPDSVIRDSYDLLKKGGLIYIKDFYPLEIRDPEKSRIHLQVIERINEAYRYSTLDLTRTISSLRQAGFEIEFIKKFQFKDDIAARSDFEAANGIDLYQGRAEFRIAEWLEIRCRKPEYPLF